MKKIFILRFIMLIVVFSGCSSEDNNENSSSASAVVNGKEWKATKPIIAGLVKISNVGLRFNIYLQDDSSELQLSFSSEIETNDAMPLKTYNWYNDKTNQDKITDAFFLNSSRIDGKIYTEHSPISGKITITALDPEKKTISGTFSFITEKFGVLQTKIVTPQVVEVTNGVFANLSYTMQTIP